MASAEVGTLCVIFRVTQVAWPETFKFCYNGISVWICPPPLSDLKLGRTAKICSCWTDQHFLPKYWIHHSSIAFQSRFVLYNTMGPYSAGDAYMEWDPVVTGTLTHAHDHKPDHVHNKPVSKQIHVIKWWHEWPRQRPIHCG